MMVKLIEKEHNKLDIKKFRRMWIWKSKGRRKNEIEDKNTLIKCELIKVKTKVTLWNILPEQLCFRGNNELSKPISW